MREIAALLSDPSAWAALATMVVLEVVLGIDNLIVTLALGFLLMIGTTLLANAWACTSPRATSTRRWPSPR